MNREGWRMALASAGGQIIVTLALCGLLLATMGQRGAWSALLGGGIGTVGNLALGTYMFTVNHATPQAMLRGFYIGEALKLTLTGVLFFLALVYADIQQPILLLAFILALAAQWMLPGALGNKWKGARS
ncbi:MAG: ATP synthase subunit I [Gammaproteobacteria bacterium]|nr:ATP synthase subunit I [Gammaproteobacteria bacterium]